MKMPVNKRRRTMKPRMNFFKAAPDTIKALVAVEDQIKASGLEHSLIELVKTRASQINGCAYCIDMHTTDARKARRDRAAAVSAQRLARVAALYRSRARRAGLDRGADADLGDACARRRLRGDARPVLGSRGRQPHHADRRHQRLESRRDRLPRHPSGEGEGGGGGRSRPPSLWRSRHRSRAAGPSSGRACRCRPSCRRSTRRPARTRWRW